MLRIAMLVMIVCLSDSGVTQDLKTKVSIAELMSVYRNEADSILKETDKPRSGFAYGILRDLDKLCNNSQNEECLILLQNKIEPIGRKRRSISPPYKFCFDGEIVRLYNPEKEICCYGIIKESLGHEICCNKSIIDSTKHYCCNEVIHNRTEGEACCGRVVYDTSLSVCCNGILGNNFKNAECCDNQVYNSRDQLCCFNRTVLNKTEGDKCCGMAVYNSSTEICCGTKAQPTYNGNKRKTDLCCGEKSYHSECYNCIGNELYPIHGDQICCDGQLKERVFGNNTGCCSAVLIDETTYMCVNNEILSRNTITEGTTVYNVSGFSISTIRVLYEPRSSEERNIVVIAVVYGSASCTIIGLVIGTALCCRHRLNTRRNKSSLCIQWDEPLSDNVCNSSNEMNNSNKPLCDPSSSRIEFDNNWDFSTEMDSCNKPLCDPATDRIDYENDLVRSSALDQCRIPKLYVTPSKSRNNDCEETTNFMVDFNTIESYKRMISMDDADFLKTKTNIKENTYDNYFKSVWTQTCINKVSNRRNILGRNFDYTVHLNRNKSTIQMPHSEVKMTLPHSTLLEGEVEVNASTFRSLTEVQKKFDLSEDEQIASPAVEYVLTGYTTLKDYAVVVMPFVGAEEDLKVIKFKSDDGLKAVADTQEVPKQGKANEELDLYYIVKGCFVHIYTKSFSGFYCATCKHNRQLKLRAFIYGSYKRFLSPLRYEVRMMMYVADDVLKFDDYKERMNDNEARQGRILKKETHLKLPDKLDDDKCDIKAEMSPTDGHDGQWIHKLHPGNGKPIYDAIQTLRLSDIVEKCEGCSGCHLAQNEIPYNIEWYLRSKDGEHPSYQFQCIIDVNTTGLAKKDPVPTRIVIDELQLRQEDRFPVEEDYSSRCIKGVKEYIDAGILPRQRTELLKMLVSQTKSQGQTTEDVFFHLQEKYTSKGLLEAVATAMKSLRMYDDIDKLTKFGYLPRTLLQTPLQSVSVEEPPNAESLVNSFERSAPGTGERGAASGRGEAQNTSNYHDIHNQPCGDNLVPGQCRDQPRPELDNAHLASTSSGESTLTSGKADHGQSNEYVYSEMVPVRREMESHVHSADSDPTICPELPVQEHASLEETDLKEIAASSP